jgi:hypothetical protein
MTSRAQEPLLPGVILHGVEPFAATEVGDLDVALPPIDQLDELIFEALPGRIVPSLSATARHRYRHCRRRGFLLRKLLDRRL